MTELMLEQKSFMQRWTKMREGVWWQYLFMIITMFSIIGWSLDMVFLHLESTHMATIYIAMVAFFLTEDIFSAIELSQKWKKLTGWQRFYGILTWMFYFALTLSIAVEVLHLFEIKLFGDVSVKYAAVGRIMKLAGRLARGYRMRKMGNTVSLIIARLTHKPYDYDHEDEIIKAIIEKEKEDIKAYHSSIEQMCGFIWIAIYTYMTYKSSISATTDLIFAKQDLFNVFVCFLGYFFTTFAFIYKHSEQAYKTSLEGRTMREEAVAEKTREIKILTKKVEGLQKLETQNVDLANKNESQSAIITKQITELEQKENNITAIIDTLKEQKERMEKKEIDLAKLKHFISKLGQRFKILEKKHEQSMKEISALIKENSLYARAKEEFDDICSALHLDTSQEILLYINIIMNIVPPKVLQAKSRNIQKYGMEIIQMGKLNMAFYNEHCKESHKELTLDRMKKMDATLNKVLSKMQVETVLHDISKATPDRLHIMMINKIIQYVGLITPKRDNSHKAPPDAMKIINDGMTCGKLLYAILHHRNMHGASPHRASERLQ